jgi:hypothetical protein
MEGAAAPPSQSEQGCELAASTSTPPCTVLCFRPATSRLGPIGVQQIGKTVAYRCRAREPRTANSHEPDVGVSQRRVGIVADGAASLGPSQATAPVQHARRVSRPAC